MSHNIPSMTHIEVVFVVSFNRVKGVMAVTHSFRDSNFWEVTASPLSMLRDHSQVLVRYVVPWDYIPDRMRHNFLYSVTDKLPRSFRSSSIKGGPLIMVRTKNVRGCLVIYLSHIMLVQRSNFIPYVVPSHCIDKWHVTHILVAGDIPSTCLPAETERVDRQQWTWTWSTAPPSFFAVVT